MKLHTLATQPDHEIVTYHKQYLKLVEYTQADCQRLMDQAKYYYIKMHGESESTDFNDNYSDSWTNYYPITLQNILVANGNFVGAVVQGTGKYERSYVICTIDASKAHWYDGSDYSSTSKDYFLLKYDLPECALDIAKDYVISQTSLQYKKGNGSKPDKLTDTYNYTHLLMAFDVLVENGVAIGVKKFDHTFLLADQSTWSKQVTKQDEYVSTRYSVVTLALTKTK
ncbi:MAG: hypothetical protein J6Q55_00855 [Clostridia bacterium]|nr:hypothetical protein [Clostridia bacterium]